ncbi:MAG: four helix bundle protein [Bacteroidales bacterium]|nr:four helix bundle protein [Bacteroidales bacterium]
METQERTGCFFRFEELRIYSKAVAYSQWLLRTMHAPANEGQKNLFDTFCHSSYDIALNIAEGSSRNKSQFEHYLKIAKTAIRECFVFTTMATGMGMMTEEEGTQSGEYLMEMTRMLGALIISLQRGRRSQDDDRDAMPADEGDDMLDNIETDF